MSMFAGGRVASPAGGAPCLTAAGSRSTSARPATRAFEGAFGIQSMARSRLGGHSTRWIET
jgi:hypothetical protein